MTRWARRASEFGEIGRELLAATDLAAMFTLVSARTVADVPGAEQAGVTVMRGSRFATLAARGKDVSAVDRLQYELNSGPCLEALIIDRPVHVDDLTTEPRWPGFGAQAVQRTGVRSVLSYRLFLEADPAVTAALNMYAQRPAAFTAESHQVGLLLATHAAHAVTSVAARQRAANLQVALANSQVIGVVMGLHGIARKQAFDLLRMASQHRSSPDPPERSPAPRLPVGATGYLPTRRHAVPATLPTQGDLRCRAPNAPSPSRPPRPLS